VSDPTASFSLPSNWVAPGVTVADQETKSLKHESGAEAALAMIVLDDGTNISLVGGRSGLWALRMGPATGWAIQEHQIGEPPKVFRGVWRRMVEAQIEAKRIAGPPPEAGK